ncbi:hypothetical protein CBL_01973 [Carabus blaptoides fortunei]
MHDWLYRLSHKTRYTIHGSVQSIFPSISSDHAKGGFVSESACQQFATVKRGCPFRTTHRIPKLFLGNWDTSNVSDESSLVPSYPIKQSKKPNKRRKKKAKYTKKTGK